ncbi:hypothetical protein AVEN_49323-1 [Araneus ventricosus]|uniref:Uncharacterized protein n=1 Tax=Araneus ventricosus TaxID=182803 RepID=A0A4Y2UFH4_ARAVE|nr:hypothetical protein AVEN_49323-1 [Araneus ventricosus]
MELMEHEDAEATGWRQPEEQRKERRIYQPQRTLKQLGGGNLKNKGREGENISPGGSLEALGEGGVKHKGKRGENISLQKS